MVQITLKLSVAEVFVMVKLQGKNKNCSTVRGGKTGVMGLHRNNNPPYQLLMRWWLLGAHAPGVFVFTRRYLVILKGRENSQHKSGGNGTTSLGTG